MESFVFGSAAEMEPERMMRWFKCIITLFVPDCLHMSGTRLSQATLINSQPQGVRGARRPMECSTILCLDHMLVVSWATAQIKVVNIYVVAGYSNWADITVAVTI